jgi:hypothetical protein
MVSVVRLLNQISSYQGASQPRNPKKMTSIFRAFRNNAPSRNRHSVASTNTHSSSKTEGDHTSSNKRGHSLFDFRASWTPGTMPLLDDEPNYSLAMSVNNNITPTGNVSESGSGQQLVGSNAANAAAAAAEASKRFRNITPKIQALKAMFEFRSFDSDKENKPFNNMEAIISPPSSPVKTTSLRKTPSPTKQHFEGPKALAEIAITQPIQANAIVIDSRSSTDKSSINSAPVPSLPVSSKARNILKTAPSIMDLAKKKWSRDGKRKPAPETSEKLLVYDQKLEDTWIEKVNGLVEWTNQGMGRGDIPQMVFVIHDGFKGNSEEASSRTSGLLLTPEEDLKECVEITSCHPHLTPYFAKVLRDVSL